VDEKQFKNLSIGEHFHDPKNGYEWKVIGHKTKSLIAECTEVDPNDDIYSVGQQMEWDYDVFEYFAIGLLSENKINYEGELTSSIEGTEQRIIKCELRKLTLKKGDKVYIEATVDFIEPNGRMFFWVGDNGVVVESKATVIYLPPQ